MLKSALRSGNRSANRLLAASALSAFGRLCDQIVPMVGRSAVVPQQKSPLARKSRTVPRACALIGPSEYDKSHRKTALRLDCSDKNALAPATIVLLACLQFH